MSESHASHSHGAGAPESKLRIALALTATFLVVETVAAFLTGSLALLSDAAHMLTDVAALAIALAAIKIGKRAADKKRTFGYYRFEILAAAFNAVVLFLVAVYILYEAFQRFRTPQDIASGAMLAVAVVGLVVNLISMRILRDSSRDSLNVKGAYLEVWADMIGSAGVIAAALIIRFTGWRWVDTLMAVGIGLWVLPRTWTLLRASLNVLLQGVPEGFDLSRIEADILAVPGVAAVHDLHLWALTSGRNVMSAHLVLAGAAGDEARVLQATSEMLVTRYQITRSTLQVEPEGFHPEPAGAAKSHEHGAGDGYKH